MQRRSFAQVLGCLFLTCAAPALAKRPTCALLDAGEVASAHGTPAETLP